MSKLSKLWPHARSKSDRLCRLSKSGLALCLLFAAGAALTPRPADAASNLKVQTKEGPVKGFLKNSVAEFLGIPYAEPPVGNLRWTPPKKHAPWTTVLKATAYGPTCAQITTLGVFAGPPNNNEDCLYLNVFTPSVDPAATEKLPVFLFVHGGGNIDGESNDYDASKLAAQGHIVVVTINYQLGLLGFFAHPAIDAEGHLFGNYGLLDQQLALKWVQRNIAGFGGDKNNVTLGGQSAGSKNTIANIVSPLDAGLFKRAILESLFNELTPLPYAETLGTNFAVAAGCGSGKDAATAKCLRSLTAAQIMSLQGIESAAGPYGQNFVADGQIVPSGGLETAIANGQFNHVPVISGTTEDEGTFTLAGTEYFKNPRVPFTADDVTNYIQKTFTGNSGPGGAPPAYPAGTANKVLAQYPLYAYATPELAYEAIITSTNYACPLHHILGLLSSQVPVYYYEFQDRTAPYYFPKMPGFLPLASHTIDLQFLFPLYHGGPNGIPHELNKKEQALSDELVAAWTNFTWTSNPNGIGNSPWPRYKLKAANSYILAENVPTLSTILDAQFVAEHKCDFWDTILTY